MNLSPAQKSLVTVVAVACVLSFAVAAWAVTAWGFSRARASAKQGGITVSDSAEVKADPDVAHVTLGVVTKNRDAGHAARVNADKTAAVVAAVVKLGLPKSGIRTVDYSLQPEYNYDKNPYPIVGYEARNSVSIKVTKLADIGKLIDAAIATGANSVQNVSFDVQDKTKLRQKALAEAVKKAESKARTIAHAMGADLGRPMSASEDVSYYQPSYSNYSYKYRKVALAAREATPISAGKTKVSAQVKIVYSIR